MIVSGRAQSVGPHYGCGGIHEVHAHDGAGLLHDGVHHRVIPAVQSRAAGAPHRSFDGIHIRDALWPRHTADEPERPSLNGR